MVRTNGSDTINLHSVISKSIHEAILSEDFSFNAPHSLTWRNLLKKDDEEECDRLEFIGDAVMSLCVAMELYRKFPGRNSGFYTKLRAPLTSNLTFIHLMRKVGLERYRPNARTDQKAIADAFEGMVAAMFLQEGLSYVLQWLRHELGPLLVVAQKKHDAITRTIQMQKLARATRRVDKPAWTRGLLTPRHLPRQSEIQNSVKARQLKEKRLRIRSMSRSISRAPPEFVDLTMDSSEDESTPFGPSKPLSVIEQCEGEDSSFMDEVTIVVTSSAKSTKGGPEPVKDMLFAVQNTFAKPVLTTDQDEADAEELELSLVIPDAPDEFDLQEEELNEVDNVLVPDYPDSGSDMDISDDEDEPAPSSSRPNAAPVIPPEDNRPAVRFPLRLPSRQPAIPSTPSTADRLRSWFPLLGRIQSPAQLEQQLPVEDDCPTPKPKPLQKRPNPMPKPIPQPEKQPSRPQPRSLPPPPTPSSLPVAPRQRKNPPRKFEDTPPRKHEITRRRITDPPRQSGTAECPIVIDD